MTDTLYTVAISGQLHSVLQAIGRRYGRGVEELAEGFCWHGIERFTEEQQ